MKNQIKISVLLVITAGLLAAFGLSTSRTPPQFNPAQGSRFQGPPVLDAFPYPLELPKGTYRADSIFGPFELKLADGYFTLAQIGRGLDAEGTYVVVGDEITFLVKKDEIVFGDEGAAGRSTCSIDDSPYTYAWSFNGESLAFGGTADHCSQRRSIYTGWPWVKLEQ